MIATSFSEENLILDPPPQLREENIECLPVFAGRAEDGTPIVISCWKITAEEMEEMKKTGRVWLMVFGHGMPVVSVVGKNPFRGNVGKGEIV